MKIEVNGIKMNYEISGRDDGAVVMLSHSLASSLVMWQPQLAALESVFKVLRFDTRGHGDSDAPEGKYTLELLTQDAVALLDALEIDAVHFVGLSMGGMIGQNFALDYGSRLKSLALCDTTAFVPAESQPIWDQRIATVRKTGMQSQVDETLERWFTAPYLEQNPPMVDVIRRLIADTPVSGYVGCCEAIRRLDNLERLSRIDVPTLIIVGADDVGTPVAVSEAMHKRITGSKLVVLPDARHLSNIEQEGGFNRTLLEFLLSLLRSEAS